MNKQTADTSAVAFAARDQVTAMKMVLLAVCILVIGLMGLLPVRLNPNHVGRPHARSKRPLPRFRGVILYDSGLL